MNVLLINAHHEYPGWSTGKLNHSAQEVAKDLFTGRGDQVVETIVDAGYDLAD